MEQIILAYVNVYQVRTYKSEEKSKNGYFSSFLHLPLLIILAIFLF